ncbi:MAG: ribonuclease III [Candidatus Paceibacterota bacterium]|jgi:ribonuclease-3
MKDFEQKIGYQFKNQDLLRQAFLHRSYLNEHKDTELEHNERLEFLGDAVLELVVTDWLYRNYPDKPEGELTAYRAALVNANTCGALALEWGMNELLMLSKGEAKDTGRARQIILANAFEAFVGAIYLDGGYESAKNFITKTVFPKADEVIKKNLVEDYKSAFQKKAQETEGITPTYKVLSEAGPDHDKKFTVGLYLADAKIAEGSGHAKQEAEQSAARAGLETKGWQ